MTRTRSLLGLAPAAIALTALSLAPLEAGFASGSDRAPSNSTHRSLALSTAQAAERAGARGVSIPLPQRTESAPDRAPTTTSTQDPPRSTGVAKRAGAHGVSIPLPQRTESAPDRAPDPTERDSDPALQPIPEPNLAEVEPAIVEQLAEQRTRLDGLLANPAADRAELAEAMGKLGQLYVLYEMFRPAEVALANAERLDPDDMRWPYFLAAITQEESRLDEARAYLLRALELEPHYLPALIRLGDLERTATRPEEARRWYRHALEVAPASPAANWGLGQIAFGEGDAVTAAEHFEAVLDVVPQATAVHYPLGLAYRDLGDLDKAREHLAQRGQVSVTRYDPLVSGLAELVAGASLHMVRANQAFARGNLETAVESYQRAVEADPDNITARQALASTLSRLGDLESAREHILWVIERGEGDAVSHYNLATLYSQEGRLEDAEDQFRRALELDGELIDAHYNLGVLLDDSGRAAAALGHFEAVLEMNPQDVEARVRHAVSNARLGRLEPARAELESVLAGDPEQPAALLALATIERLGGGTEAALAAYRRLIESEAAGDEDRARAHFESGTLLLAEDRLEAAVGHLERAADLMPGIPDVRVALASALGRAGRFREAAAQYDALLERDPDLAEAHFGRGLSLLLAGRDGEARRALEASLERRPDDLALLHLLARLMATSPDPAVRDGARALGLAERLMRTQQTLDHAQTVAMALAEVGRFSEAVELQRQILERAAMTGAADVGVLRRHLDLYTAGQPVRAPWRAAGEAGRGAS